MNFTYKKTFALLLIAFILLFSVFSSDSSFSCTKKYNQLLEAYKAEFYPGVLLHGMEFLEKFPHSVLIPEVKLYTGEALCNLNQLEKAKPLLKEAVNFLAKNSEQNILCGIGFYWLGYISFEEKDNITAAHLLSQGTTLLKDEKTEKHHKLYLEGLLLGAKACYNSGNAQAGVPVLEYLWNETSNPESVLLLFRCYNECNVPEKTVEAYSKIIPDKLSSSSYEEISLYAAKAYTETDNKMAAFDLYCHLISTGSEAVSSAALKAAWELADDIPNSSRDNLLTMATNRLSENPLILAEFRTRLGIEEFKQGDFEEAKKSFSLSLDFLKNELLDSVSKEKAINLEEINVRYLAEITFRTQKSITQGATEAYEQLYSWLKTLDKDWASSEDSSIYEDASLFDSSILDSSIIAQLCRYGIYKEDWKAAFTLGKKALDNQEAAFWCATGAFKLGDAEESLAILKNHVFNKKNIELHKNLIPQAAVLYADALSATGKKQEALNIFIKLDENGLLNSKDYLNFASLALYLNENSLAYKAASKSKEEDSFYLAALASFNRQDWQTAETMFTTYISCGAISYSSFAEYYLALIYYKQSDWQNAYQRFEDFAKNNPFHLHTRNAKKSAIICALQLHQQTGQEKWLDSAIQNAKDLVQNSPSVSEKEEAVSLLAGIYADAKKHQLALDLLNPYLSRQDAFGNICRQQAADYLVALGEYDKADEILLKTIELADSTETAQTASYRRGEIFYTANQYEKAAVRFSEYRKTYPSGIFVDAALYFNGESLKKSGQPDQAILCFNTLVTNFPKSSFVFNALQELETIYREQQDYGAALKTANILLENYQDRALLVGIEQEIKELELLNSGLEEKIVLAKEEYENTGKMTTTKGRKAALTLAEMYLASVETEKEGLALAEELISVLRPIQTKETETTGRVAMLLGDYYRLQDNFDKAATLFLEAATLLANIDSQQAAIAMYRAAETFFSNKKTGDANSTVLKMEELFPESEWTKAGAKFKKP